MNPLALALFQFAPYLLAFVVGALVPRRQGTPERIAIGIVAALSLLLVRGLWPSATPAVVDENAKEWPYLLSVIVFLPILGAVFLLFLPRQSPVILKRVTFLILGLHGAMMGAFVSLDLFLFFVFWELMLIPMIVMIGVWGGVEKVKAAYKFFIYTMVGSMLMLAA